MEVNEDQLLSTSSLLAPLRWSSSDLQMTHLQGDPVAFFTLIYEYLYNNNKNIKNDNSLIILL